MTWRFEWIAGGVSRAPDDLNQRWDAAFERCGNIWQCREFVLAWESIMAPRRQQTPVLIVAHDACGHEVVYPLFKSDHKLFRFNRATVEPMGGCDYQDPLSTGAVMQPDDELRFWQAFREELRKALPRRFGFFSEFSAHRLTWSAAKQGSGFIKSDVSSPLILLSGLTGLDDFLVTRGKKLRRYVSKGLKYVNERGCNGISLVKNEQILPAMQSFCESYEKQWGLDGKPHRLQLPGTREFWTSIALSAARLNKLHFSSLIVDGDHWHWHLGFEHRRTILWYKPSYDRKFSKYSPGLLHLAMIIQDGIERGSDSVDLGYGAEAYKFRWTERENHLASIRVEHAAGQIAAARGALSVIRKAKQRLFT